MITKKQLTTQLKKLVEIQTLSGNMEANSQALDYIESLLNKKAQIKRIKHKSAEILLAGNHDLLNPEYGYMVHVDVVAAPKELFTMQLKGSIVKGRGVSDMKFSIPIGIALLNELIQTNSQTSFTLVITTDEERGGFDGAEHLAQQLKFRPNCLIVPDGGDNLEFVNKSKGVLQLRLTSTGTPAHASRVWKGKNAIIPLSQVVVKLAEKYTENNAQAGWNTTLNFGTISGGISTNQVCPEASVEIDFRYPESVKKSELHAEVQEVVNSIDSAITITELSSGQPTFTDENLPIVKRFITALETTTKQKILVKENYGASDARHFADFNIPILMIKPIGGDIHENTEWIDLDSCMQFAEGVRLFIGLTK